MRDPLPAIPSSPTRLRSRREARLSIRHARRRSRVLSASANSTGAQSAVRMPSASPGTIRRHRVGLCGPCRCPWLGDDDRIGAVNLIEREKVACQREFAKYAALVLHNMRARIISRSRTAIERSIDAFRHATLPPEKSVRDCGGVGKIGGSAVSAHQNPGGGGTLGGMIASALNRCSHLLRCGQPLICGFYGFGLSGISGCQLFGPARDAQTLQKCGLAPPARMLSLRRAAPLASERAKSTCADRSAVARRVAESARCCVLRWPAAFRRSLRLHSHSRRSVRRRRVARCGWRFLRRVRVAGRRCFEHRTRIGSPRVIRRTARPGTAIGASAKPSSPCSRVTMRSRQPFSVFTYWRMGSASKNSLARRNSGVSPSAHRMLADQRIGVGEIFQRLRLHGPKRGACLDQHDIQCRKKPCIEAWRRATRPPSVCRVPGPSSTRSDRCRASLLAPNLRASTGPAARRTSG